MQPSFICCTLPVTTSFLFSGGAGVYKNAPTLVAPRRAVNTIRRYRWTWTSHGLAIHQRVLARHVCSTRSGSEPASLSASSRPSKTLLAARLPAPGSAHAAACLMPAPAPAPHCTHAAPYRHYTPAERRAPHCFLAIKSPAGHRPGVRLPWPLPTGPHDRQLGMDDAFSGR